MNMDVIVCHNPDCGTSRNTIGLMRNAGVEPHIIEYLKTTPTRLLLRQLIERMGVSFRDIIRGRARLTRNWGSVIRRSATTRCSRPWWLIRFSSIGPSW